MDHRTRKPKLSPKDLIAKLRDEKGVWFEKMDEDTAALHLSERNNYLRTASYRKNYVKHGSGVNKGKYIHLDFAYLVELSTLDMHLRSCLLRMCIDIEHALKVRLLADMEKQDEDGYALTEAFLSENPHILEDIENKAEAVFTGDLVSAYFKLCYVVDFERSTYRIRILKVDCPLWVLVELLSFGDFLKLYHFYRAHYPSAELSLDKHLLNPVRSLRNACAHNNCLLNRLSRTVNTHPPAEISTFIKEIASIGREERRKKLASRPMFEMICMLYVYKEVVSDQVRENGLQDMNNFCQGRLVRHLDYFESNPLVKTSFSFLQKVVDSLTQK